MEQTQAMSRASRDPRPNHLPTRPNLHSRLRNP